MTFDDLKNLTLEDMKSFAVNNVDWVIAACAAAVLWLVLTSLRSLILAKLKKRADQDPDADFLHGLLALVKRTSQLSILAVSLYIPADQISLPEQIDKWIGIAILVILVIQVAVWIDVLVVETLKRKSAGESNAVSGAGRLLKFVLKGLIWSGALLFLLDNLGVNITALVAGLGVGGIAIGLAVQSILGDLFASLAIVLDKPFEVGDFVIFDSYMGTVESIGLKTTRIRSLSGEQIVCSNADLLSSRIRNYKRMNERRAVFTIGVVYGTPADQMEEIPKIIKEIIEKHDDLRFDRSHFFKYGAYSLDFETVYWIKDADYNVYMDRQQAINMKIYRAFEDKGIEFAYPTQTIFQPDVKNED